MSASPIRAWVIFREDEGPESRLFTDELECRAVIDGRCQPERFRLVELVEATAVRELEKAARDALGLLSHEYSSFVTFTNLVAALSRLAPAEGGGA